MGFKKCQRTTTVKGKIQNTSKSRRALVHLKRLLGDDVAKSNEENTPPIGEGVTNKTPLRKTDGSRYDWEELAGDPDFVRKQIYTLRSRDGSRYYKKGNPKYKREDHDAAAVIKILQSIGPDIEIRYIDENTGYGMFVGLRPTAYDSTLNDKDGKPLMVEWSRPMSRNDGGVTQSEASVVGPGFLKGQTLDHLLNGPLQFINHGCSDCATHFTGEWTKNKIGIKQRAAQLMPGTEITLCYGIPEYDQWCQGPNCQNDKWDFIRAGGVWKGFKVCEEGVFVPK